MQDGEELRAYSSMAGKLDPRLLEALNVMNFTHMSPVQDRVLSEIPTFQSDCLVQAKTGTGKTVAFLLPVLHSLLSSPSRPPRGQVAVLIISPTRELALQIAKECEQLTSQITPKIECHTAFGGSARASNLERFMRGSPSVLVATPGRLKDYLSEAQVAKKFSNIRTLILDEADTMLEAGFLADVRHILKLLPPKSSSKWQGMCFSATIPEKIKDVIGVVLGKEYTHLSTIGKNEAPTHEKVPQYHVIIPHASQTFTALLALLKQEEAHASKIIVFGITANMVALFANVFSQVLTNMKVYQLHSRLSQANRIRTTAEFKDAESGILFASDVVGRGMDFQGVDLIIQLGLPSTEDQYVHRVGRTARAGASGRAIIMLTTAESFFLTKNSQLPINAHPKTAEIVDNADAQTPIIQRAMRNVDAITKKRAYSSYIGFFANSGLLRPLGLDSPGLVQLANDVAIHGMYCSEPPPMEKQLIGKMRMKGVPGFNIATESDIQSSGAAGQHRRVDNQQDSRKMQSIPGSLSKGITKRPYSTQAGRGAGGRGGSAGRGRGRGTGRGRGGSGSVRGGHE